MMISRTIIMAVMVAILTGCGHVIDKQELGIDEREQVRIENGEPDRSYLYDNGNDYTETWWYYSKGIAYTFGKDDTNGIMQIVVLNTYPISEVIN